MNAKNFKIICIVKNDSKENSQGLRLAFNEKTNQFVEKYFYVNSSTFSELFGSNAPNKFLVIKQNTVKEQNIPPLNSDEWDILLVSDDVTIDEMKKIPFTGETLVMYHNKPSDAKKIFEDLQKENKILKCKQGAHEDDPDQGYTLLLELTECYDGTGFNYQEYYQAKERLIQWFGLYKKLNAVLEFLHNCIGNNVKDSILTKAGFHLKSKENGKKCLEDLIIDFEKGLKIPVLKDLRDTLVEIALREK